MTKLRPLKHQMRLCQNYIPQRQSGASLIIVMIILTIVSLLGVAGIQISMMSERGARNDRDQQIAWQAAEAALIDAEYDIYGPTASTRRIIFAPNTDLKAFLDGCGSGNAAGLCALNPTGKPAWLTANFDATGDTAAPAARFGQFTGRTFPSGSVGVQPVKPPRYTVEPILDQFGPGSASRDLGNSNPKYVYRVTAMGFGPRPEVRAVVQMIYRN